ncbi:MAG: type III-B CRISPR module RAMP protein Cmr6 [Burkholderiaceae bacterium]
MPIAAVPNYLGKNFRDASPGLRFGMLLPVWNLAQLLDNPQGTRGQLPQEQKIKIDNKADAIQQACHLNQADQALLRGIIQRQASLADCAAHLLNLEATATAPFTTGLGNEHPLENGFAFLNPYGLPYLAGSGIKGVIRQAARELASGEWGEPHGWSDEKHYAVTADRQTVLLSSADVLFGLEADDEDTLHLRGVLGFWDVIPKVRGNGLQVEIMTPHQSHYYQQGKADGPVSPHDGGQPIPIYFLTVPPGSSMRFHVQCDQPRLESIAPDLAADGRWQVLLTAAFEHAFEWLGFGAKTAVGYGAMESLAQRDQRLAVAAQRQEEARQQQKIEIERRQAEEAVPWNKARITYNRRNGTLTVTQGAQTAHARPPLGEELLGTLPEPLQKKVRTGGSFVRVTAYVAGSALVRIEAE